MRQAMTRLIAMDLPRRSAVSWAASSIRHPDFEHPMPVLDSPAQTVPAQTPLGILHGLDLHGRQQVPFNPFLTPSGGLSSSTCTTHRTIGRLVFMVIGRAQLHPLVANRCFRGTCGAAWTCFLLAFLRSGTLPVHLDAKIGAHLRLPDSLKRAFPPPW
jgi:hypothetical protein